jgi:hypothetical protein
MRGWKDAHSASYTYIIALLYLYFFRKKSAIAIAFIVALEPFQLKAMKLCALAECGRLRHAGCLGSSYTLATPRTEQRKNEGTKVLIHHDNFASSSWAVLPSLWPSDALNSLARHIENGAILAKLHVQDYPFETIPEPEERSAVEGRYQWQRMRSRMN